MVKFIHEILLCNSEIVKCLFLSEMYIMMYIGT